MFIHRNLAEPLSEADSAFKVELQKAVRQQVGILIRYELETLPRTNNDLESLFRDAKRRLLRTTGQRGQTRRALQRTVAWELLPRPPSEAEFTIIFLQHC